MTTRNLVRSLLILIVAATAASGDRVSAAGPSVQVEGLISAKGSNTITVDSQLIVVPSNAVIRHGQQTFTFSDLKVGDRVHVVGVRVTGSDAAQSLEASEVRLQNAAEQEAEGGGDPGPAGVLVSVAVLDATGAEVDEDPVSFRLTRTGDLSAPLTVTFDLTGDARNFVDYQAHWYTADFLAGESTAVVTIVPVTDEEDEGPESVILTVLDGTGYTAGSPAIATATIVS
jgi:hypothetical protein